MDELKQSTKYVPAYELKKRYEEEAQELGKAKGKKERDKEIARAMKKKGVDIEMIMEFTGLSKQVIQRLKVE